MKVGLHIVNQIHTITQAGYEVRFCGDFEGMVTIGYSEEYNNDFYHHEHLGFPGCDRDRLERDIIESLSKFITGKGIQKTDNESKSEVKS